MSMILVSPCARRRNLHIHFEQLQVSWDRSCHLHCEWDLLRVRLPLSALSVPELTVLTVSVVTHTGAASEDGFVACKGD